MKIIAIIFFTFLSIQLLAQGRLASFSTIEKRVKTIQSTSPDTLSQKLTAPYKTDTEKVWAIFRWITENITYDTLGYNHPEKLYEGLWELSLTAGYNNVENEYDKRIIEKVLTEKKAVCDGYSRLFKKLCGYAKIRCEIITGFIRWSSDPIGQRTNRRHAWNAIYINETWKLIDATWASGYRDGKSGMYKKSFDDLFFFTNPIHLFNDHYPDDNKWTFLTNTPSLDQFYDFPFYHPSFYKFKFSSVNPTTGYITVSRTNKIATIELITNDAKKNVYIFESPSIDENDSLIGEQPVTQPDPVYKIEKNKITCLYHIQSDKTERLNVVYNGKLILTYRVRFVR